MENVKVMFGLVQQGHIPTIERIIDKWNKSFKEQFPNEPEKVDHKYSKHVWEEIGKEIGWCPFTACLYYFEYLGTFGK